MNQIMLYGGFSTAGVMFFLCVIIWFRLHIWKIWRDISSYRVQKLGNGSQINSMHYSTMPLPVRHHDSGQTEWDVLDEVIFTYTKGI